MPTILLAENDARNRDMLRRWLARWGYHVLLAADGIEALALAATAHPAVILMDLNMPVLDGLEATTRLKAALATQAIPILVLTARALADDRGRALAAGAGEYEPQPSAVAGLHHKIAAFVTARVAPPPAEDR